MIQFVLQRTSFKGIRADLDFPARARQLTGDHQSSRPADVTGEIGHRHAALASPVLARGAQDHRVDQDEGTVAGDRLGVSGDIHTEHPRRDPDLIGRQADAPG